MKTALPEHDFVRSFQFCLIWLIWVSNAPIQDSVCSRLSLKHGDFHRSDKVVLSSTSMAIGSPFVSTDR